MATPRPVLSVRNLSKTFPGQRALDGVSLDVTPGEIHALVGENGSGKSTLIKCLSGYHEPDYGSEIQLGGTKLALPYSPSQAHSLGLAFIHQDLGLIPSLTVLENLALGRGFATSLRHRIRWRSENKRARKVLQEFGYDIDPQTLVRHLSASERTIVAIARGLQDARETAELLVLDEPTAALAETEVRRLFDALRRITERGVGILYVSHRLEEIFAISQRVTIIRDGRYVATRRTIDLSERELVSLIVGKPLDKYYPLADSTPGRKQLLEVSNLGGRRLRDVSFTLREGEILGVAGLLGSGRSELARILFGAQQRASGSILIDGEDIRLRSPAQAIRAGIALVPEDRRSDGAIPRMSVMENMTLPDLAEFATLGRLRKRAERDFAQNLAETFRIVPRDASRPFYVLSGGNQQKAILAKWMHLHPRLLILDEPVQGVDIGSKTEIYEMIETAAADGAGVLVITSEFEDLAHLCDRVIVLREGRVVGELIGDELQRERMLQLVYLARKSA